MSEIIVIPEGEHSILGPSSADRWTNCPGSVLAPGIAKQTEYAASGTASHTLSEWAREQGKHASEWKGKTLQVGEYSFKIGKPAIESVMTFVDSCAKIEGAPYYEARVSYDYWVPGGFGTLDDARVRDNVCTVTDFKDGTGIKVFAKDNAQLKLYAAGLYSKLDWLFDFDRFILRICQPRLRHFEEFEISLGHLMQWMYDTIRPAAKLAMTPGAPIVAGPWCKFCKIKDSCQTRAQYKMMMRNRELNAETEFEDMTENVQ